MTKMTFEDLKKMAEPETEETYANEAMRKLGPAFDKLRSCKKGNDFIEELERTLYSIKYGRVGDVEVNVHTVIGICQLAHHIRDEVGPSNRKSFKRIIPWLLKKRNAIQKKEPENIVEFLLQKLEERNDPAPSNVRPESIAPNSFPNFY